MTGPELNAPFAAGVNQSAPKSPIMMIRGANLFYDDLHAVKDVDLDVHENEVLALIGPSACGKSSLLRCLNRMNDTIDIAKFSGEIKLEGEDINAPNVDPVQLRARVGMVFQKANPFPKSIYDNVAYGSKIHGLARNKAELDQIVEESLIQAGLWQEVKNILSQSGTQLSGGQQQRLCIARALATQPDVLLMDEPCSALDPIATGVIEETIEQLKAQVTIVIVTHSMEQAARVSDKTAYMISGECAAYGRTDRFFTNPPEIAEGYITGRFG